MWAVGCIFAEMLRGSAQGAAQCPHSSTPQPHPPKCFCSRKLSDFCASGRFPKHEQRHPHSCPPPSPKKIPEIRTTTRTSLPITKKKYHTTFNTIILNHCRRYHISFGIYYYLLYIVYIIYITFIYIYHLLFINSYFFYHFFPFFLPFISLFASCSPTIYVIHGSLTPPYSPGSPVWTK